jgi:ferric-dicitrate binding protein FerR (iron transport regulator)
MDHSEFNIEDLITSESFVNYCYGTNIEDVLFWENKLKTNPESITNIKKAKELCLLLAVKATTEDKKIQLEKLKQEIEAFENLPKERKIVKMPVRKIWAWASIAASILILTSIYVSQYISSKSSGAALYSQVTASNYHLTARTNFDERKKMRLPDGTTVIMNGSSELKLANDYNINNRHVYLTGEAFFLVKKDHARPFVVITNKTATTALGTSFKVQSYESSSSASVMLATGKVKVESTRLADISSVKLIPGEQAVLMQGKAAFQKSGYNNSTLQNWINRKLVFSNSNLNDIVLKFTEIYGINIIAPSTPSGQVSFTGEFDNKNPTEVLEAIGFSNHFTYKQNNNNVTLIF